MRHPFISSCGPDLPGPFPLSFKDFSASPNDFCEMKHLPTITQHVNSFHNLIGLFHFFHMHTTNFHSNSTKPFVRQAITASCSCCFLHTPKYLVLSCSLAWAGTILIGINRSFLFLATTPVTLVNSFIWSSHVRKMLWVCERRRSKVS